MKTTFESRFMEVATAGTTCKMSNEELNAEFSMFQSDVRNLVMSDRGYLAIDFMLRDLWVENLLILGRAKQCVADPLKF